MGDRLKDKVAVITGAGTGIGRRIAVAYAGEGAHIVGAARRIEKLQDAAREIESMGRKFLAVKCDVSNKEDCQSVARETVKKFGKIDILVNNASIYPATPLLEITPEEWDEVLGINLKGSMLMSQAVLPQMIKQKKGKIVMVNSNVIRYSPVVYRWVHYIAAKMGVVALTRCMAAEFGPMGIQVNGFAPEYTPGTDQATRLLDPLITPDYAESILSKHPSRRFARVEDYDGIAVFLASADSDYINGQTISVDGGNTMV